MLVLFVVCFIPWNIAIFFFFFCLFRAVPAANGSSQASGWIRAAATSLHHSHSNAKSELLCNLHHSSRQHWILNLLSEARDQTHIFMDSSWVRYRWAMMGTPGKDNWWHVRILVPPHLYQCLLLSHAKEHYHILKFISIHILTCLAAFQSFSIQRPSFT